MTAEAILYKENDPLLRYAIYKAYKYRCAYTGKFLYDYSSMHLDHIIPQNTAPEVLQEKIHKISGITSKNGRNDAKRLNIRVVTVSNDDKPKNRKTQRKADLRRRMVCKSLPVKE